MDNETLLLTPVNYYETLTEVFWPLRLKKFE